MDERLAATQSDATWSFTLLDGARVALIIEAQSTVDPAMASK